MRKHVFYTHTNIVAKKWGEKTARNNFFRKTRILPAKNVVKKIVSKSAKTRFLYSHEYREQKMVAKKARNNFSRKTRIVPAKNVGIKNRLKKVR